MYRCQKRVSKYLQLGLALSLLEDRLHLGRLHDVALDLELAAHEQTLGVGLAGHEGGEVCVGEGEGDCTTTRYISIEREARSIPITRDFGIGSVHSPSALPPAGAAPWPTSPLFFRSRYQLASSPFSFFKLKATIALALSTASLRSAASAWSVWLIASKAAEAGKESVGGKPVSRSFEVELCPTPLRRGRRGRMGEDVPFLRDMVDGRE